MVRKSGVLRHYHSWLSLGQQLLDAAVVFALLPALCMMRELPWDQPYQMTTVLGALLTWAAMGAVDAYRPWRGAGLLQDAGLIIGAWLVVICALLFIAWGVKFTDAYSRLVVGGWFVLSPLALVLLHVAERAFLRTLHKNGRNTRTAVIVGAGDLGQILAARIISAEWMGIRILGFFDDDTRKEEKRIQDVPVLGKGSDVSAYVRHRHVDQVYLALPMRAEKRMRELFDALQDCTASVFLAPDLFIFELLGAREQDVDGLPVFALCDTPLSGPFGIVKRMEDIILSLIILLSIFPLMLLIAIGIRLSSQGSVFFKQYRYGLNGKQIKVYKFRTMTVCENGDEVRQAKHCDPRVTRFGAFLRRTSLDELPQFYNVLQGRMSIVGPRPHAVAHNEQYRKLIRSYMWRHKVRPGITGWAQVNGWRGETDTLDKMKKRVEYDLDYIRRWSVWLDIKIILLTVIRGFGGKNAY